MNYPDSYKKIFSPVFSTLKEAKIIAEQNGVKPVKQKNGYKVTFEGTVPNRITTGRKMNVIDNEGNLHKQILDLVYSYPFDGSYKIKGFEGIFVNRSNWNLDIYVSCTFDGSEFAKEAITKLSEEGKKEYNRITELCKPSRHLFNDIAKSDWQKAKEQNYI